MSTPTNFDAFDHALSGGISPGQLILLGGPIGIGKSTLAMQVADASKKRVLYKSFDETVCDLQRNWRRLGLNNNPNVFFADHRSVEDEIAHDELDLVIVDTVQSWARAKRTSLMSEFERLLRFVQDTGTTALCISQLNKSMDIAGDASIRYAASTEMYLYPFNRTTCSKFDRDTRMRIRRGEVVPERLRLLVVDKNRFGEEGRSTRMEMTSSGLQSWPREEAVK